MRHGTTFSSADGLFRKSLPIPGTGPVTTLTATRPFGGGAGAVSRTYLAAGSFLESLETTTLNADGTVTSVRTEKDTSGAILTTASATRDLLDRTVSQTGGRGLTTTFGEFTESGSPLLTTRSDSTSTRITLDSAARPVLAVTKDAAGATVATVHTSYHPSGNVAATWGTNTNPTYRTYDLQGRMVQLRTYRSTDPALVPTAATPGYDTTTWAYEPATGLLLTKRDAENQGTTYTYTPDGKLLTRQWARGVTTTYGYDPAGRPTSTDYSDATPDVALTYDRLGRQTGQTNGLAASTFAYNPATLALASETISYNLDGTPGFEFTRVLDRSQDPLGRGTGWLLKNGTTTENSAAYQYSAAHGRLTKVLGLASPNLASPEFAYGYEPNSNLIKTITSPAHTVTNTYEPNRDVLDTRENKAGTTLVSKYDYTVNAIGQRSNVAQTGTAFASVRDIAWGYDTLGQIVNSWGQTKSRVGLTLRNFPLKFMGTDKMYG